MHARAGPFKTGISQDRQVLEVGPGLRQDELPGRGQVVGAAGPHVADPQRHAARGGQGLHVPGGLVRLAGVPLVDLPALPAGLLVRASVGGDQRAVQDQVRKPLLNGLLQGFVQRGRLRGEHLDGLVLVPVRGGLGDPESLAQPADVRAVPEPSQREDCLLPAGQGARPVPGADLAAVICQQPGHERHQWQRDVKDDDRTARGASGTGRDLGRDLLYRGSAFPRGSRYMSACLPVTRYARNAEFTLAEKTSMRTVRHSGVSTTPLVNVIFTPQRAVLRPKHPLMILVLLSVPIWLT